MPSSSSSESCPLVQGRRTDFGLRQQLEKGTQTQKHRRASRLRSPRDAPSEGLHALTEPSCEIRWDHRCLSSWLFSPKHDQEHCLLKCKWALFRQQRTPITWPTTVGITVAEATRFIPPSGHAAGLSAGPEMPPPTLLQLATKRRQLWAESCTGRLIRAGKAG